MIGPTCRSCPGGHQAGSRTRTVTALTEIEYQRRRACPIMRTCLADANELAPNAPLHARFQIDSGRSGKRVRRAVCSQIRSFLERLDGVIPDHGGGGSPKKKTVILKGLGTVSICRLQSAFGSNFWRDRPC